MTKASIYERPSARNRARRCESTELCGVPCRARRRQIRRVRRRQIRRVRRRQIRRVRRRQIRRVRRRQIRRVRRRQIRRVRRRGACIRGPGIVYPHPMRKTRVLHSLLVPLVATVVCILPGLAGIFPNSAGWIYDTLLRVKPSVPAAPALLLIDLDQQATADAGPWPWSRDLLADGLVALKEMDASYAVLDLPLGQKSAPGLDPSALREALPAALDREFQQVEENIQSLFDAIRRGSVRPQDSPRYVSDLIGLTAMEKTRLRDAATGIERDDDTLLGQAAKFFGHT